MNTVTLPQGAELKDYRILELVTSNPLENIYKAEHILLGHTVELHEFVPAHCAVLSPDSFMLTALPGKDSAVVAAYNNFLDDVRVCSSLHHDGLPRIQTAFSGPTGTVYAVMEYKATQPLLQAISADTADEKCVSALLKQSLALLIYLQKKQLIPVELTPDCFAMVDGKIYLSLFGRLRKISTPAVAGGTPGYVAMEQLQGRHVGPASVVYSLGAVLYHLICGHAPMAAARRIGKTDAYVPLVGQSDLAERYGEYFLSTIDKALKLWPEDRWNDYSAWIAGLTPPKQGAVAGSRHSTPWQQGAVGSIKSGGGGLRLGGSGGLGVPGNSGIAAGGGGLRLVGGGMALGGGGTHAQGEGHVATPAASTSGVGISTGIGMSLGRGSAPAQGVGRPVAPSTGMNMGGGMAFGGGGVPTLGKPAAALGSASGLTLGAGSGRSLGSSGGMSLGSASGLSMGGATTILDASDEENAADSIVAYAMLNDSNAQALGESAVRAITDYFINDEGMCAEYDSDWYQGWKLYESRVDALFAARDADYDDFDEKYFVIEIDEGCLTKKKQEKKAKESASSMLDRLLSDDDSDDEEEEKSVYKGSIRRLVEHKGYQPGDLANLMGLNHNDQMLYMLVNFKEPGKWGREIEIMQIYLKRSGGEWEYVCTPKYAKDTNPHFPNKDWDRILDLVWDWKVVNYETIIDDNWDILSEKYSVERD